MSDDFQEMVSMMAEDAKGAALVVALRRIEALEGERERLTDALSHAHRLFHLLDRGGGLGQRKHEWIAEELDRIAAAFAAPMGPHSGTIEKPKVEQRGDDCPHPEHSRVEGVAGAEYCGACGTWVKPRQDEWTISGEAASAVANAAYQRGAESMRARAAQVARLRADHVQDEAWANAARSVASSIESLPLEPGGGE